ncbi:MAG: FG-GAP-like repeat-containing protein [Planctomycetota bacterium]
MLAWIVAAAALGAGGGAEEMIAPRVEVRGPDGEWVWLGDPWRVDAFVVPFTSLSEIVPRAGRSKPRGSKAPVVELGFVGGNRTALFREQIHPIEHGRDEQVLLVDGAPVIAHPFVPPREVRSSTGADLAHVVRRDDNVIRGGTVTIEPPAAESGSHLLLFGADDGPFSSGFYGWTIRVDGQAHLLPSVATEPLAIEATGATIEIELDDALLDAVAFTTIRAVKLPDEASADWMATVSVSQEDVRADRSRGSDEFDWTPPQKLSTGADHVAVPPGHRRLSRCHHQREHAEDSATTLYIRPNLQGDLAPSHPWAPPLRDHDPRTIVRYESKDLSRFTPLDSPESLREVTIEAGLGSYVHFEGPAEQLDIRPTMGPGAAWGDVDGDADLDLVLLQGGGREGCEPLADRLFLNDGDGTFTDATASAGLGRGDAGMGALLIDLDGDADLDLYCANYGLDRLFLNDGDGTFTEATDLLPGHELWSASVAAADPDGDGDLDLYVTSYLDYDPEKMPPAEELGRYQREDPIEMLPFAFPGQRNVFLRNTLVENGTLGLDDVTEELGLLDEQGRGMQSVFWDFDRDGDEDLYVANDVSFNVLFRNEGDGTFKDVSFSTGLDDPRGGMGLAVGDVDGDGDEDLFLTNWQLEANALYENAVVSHSGRKRRRASFHDATVKSGMGPSGIGKTSWGCEWFDLELDGDLDLYVANGYTSPDYESTGICVGQTDQLFVGDGTGKLREACQLGRRAFSLAFASRGAVGADVDRDGDVDLLVTANNGRATLLRNDAERQGRWLGVRLRQPGPNSHAIGATVTVDDRRQSLRAGSGYLTGNPQELHFGLGRGEGPVRVEVEWPDGEVTERVVQPDQWMTIER